MATDTITRHQQRLRCTLIGYYFIPFFMQRYTYVYTYIPLIYTLQINIVYTQKQSRVYSYYRQAIKPIILFLAFIRRYFRIYIDTQTFTQKRSQIYCINIDINEKMVSVFMMIRELIDIYVHKYILLIQAIETIAYHNRNNSPILLLIDRYVYSYITLI